MFEALGERNVVATEAYKEAAKRELALSYGLDIVDSERLVPVPLPAQLQFIRKPGGTAIIPRLFTLKLLTRDEMCDDSVKSQFQPSELEVIRINSGGAISDNGYSAILTAEPTGQLNHFLQEARAYEAFADLLQSRLGLAPD